MVAVGVSLVAKFPTQASNIHSAAISLLAPLRLPPNFSFKTNRDIPIMDGVQVRSVDL